MVDHLRLHWRADLSMEALLRLRDELDHMLGHIRSTRHISNPVFTCPACGHRGPGAEPHVSVRARILALTRHGRWRRPVRMPMNGESRTDLIQGITPNGCSRVTTALENQSPRIGCRIEKHPPRSTLRGRDTAIVKLVMHGTWHKFVRAASFSVIDLDHLPERLVDRRRSRYAPQEGDSLEVMATLR